MSRGPFTDAVVCITGASSGIGAELARQCANQGARLLLASRDVARLGQVAAECDKLNAQTLVARTDVSVEADCAVLIDRLAKRAFDGRQ